MNPKKISLLIAAIVLIIYSCKKAEQFSPIPAISFKSLILQKNSNGFDVNAHVTISFTDGDGDIGYRQLGENGSPYDDPNSPYYYNFIVQMYLLHSGNWSAVGNDTLLSGRMPYLTPEGSNKALKGDIEMDVVLPVDTIGTPFLIDTLRYDIFIYDRALHKSNTITTPQFIVKVQ